MEEGWIKQEGEVKETETSLRFRTAFLLLALSLMSVIFVLSHFEYQILQMMSRHVRDCIKHDCQMMVMIFIASCLDG